MPADRHPAPGNGIHLRHILGVLQQHLLWAVGDERGGHISRPPHETPVSRPDGIDPALPALLPPRPRGYHTPGCGVEVSLQDESEELPCGLSGVYARPRHLCVLPISILGSSTCLALPRPMYQSTPLCIHQSVHTQEPLEWDALTQGIVEGTHSLNRLGLRVICRGNMTHN